MHVAHFLIVSEACMNILFIIDVKIFLIFNDRIGFLIVSPRMVHRFVPYAA